MQALLFLYIGVRRAGPRVLVVSNGVLYRASRDHISGGKCYQYVVPVTKS